MPSNPVAVSAGIIAVSVVVAAGIAIYESPEVREFAERIRRRIAIALHSLGDTISPQERENLFNRPEDAEGFLRSRGINVRDPDIDADEETRRRQREELMYWNAVAEEKRRKEAEKAAEAAAAAEERPASKRGSSFDDFMKEDANAEKGTFVFNSGADVRSADSGLRHRGEGIRGLNQSALTNPFADEHGIDEAIAFENSLMEPDADERDETDIYSVSHDDREEQSRSATLSAPPVHEASPLVELEPAPVEAERAATPTLERQLGPDEYMTAGQEDRHDAYSSIQAWANHSSSDPSFYSPLPVSPAGPLSEPELVSDDGSVPTPTDSVSLVDADEARSTTSQERGGDYDVISDDDDTGMVTPSSWTDVGSEVSESDTEAHPTHA